MIILHGLFGQSDNWNALAKHFGESGFEVFVVDQRNHGLSEHSEKWGYKVMSKDVEELISDNKLKNIILIGHSMGGKVAMQYAIDHPENLEKLIVVDISPKEYPLHHEKVMQGLNSVDFKIVKTRKEVEEVLSKSIADLGIKQFLLKNIYWKENGELAWRFNLKVIADEIKVIGEEIESGSPSEVETLFIKGEKSNYILESDKELILKLFPNSTFETFADTGHWVHAEKPKEFFESVITFVQ